MLVHRILVRLACVVLLATTAYADKDVEVAKIIADIKSGDEVRVTQAKKSVEQLSSQIVRSQIVSELMAILTEKEKAPVSRQWTQRDSPRNTAIELLGKMQAEESIDLLIANLAPIGGTTTSWPFHGYPPAIDALARIGKTATPKLLDRMTTAENEETLRGLSLALIQIEGFDGGNKLLDNRIRSETDEIRRRNLETARAQYQMLPKVLPPPGYDDE